MARPRIRIDVQRQFWRQIRAGDSVVDAAAVASVSVTAGKRWFRHAGGVIPSLVNEPSGCRLSFAEREEITCLAAQGKGVRAIARELARDPATISRELRRVRPGRPYRASVAQASADEAACRPKPSKLATNLPLRREVQKRLKKNHSPEQISATLKIKFPDDLEMWVSPETIYQSIYVQGRGGLKRELAKHLRTGRTLRKPHRRAEEKRGRIQDMVMIADRPPEIQDRAVPGHWEGDLIVGANSGSAIGTLVERMTGFVLLLHLPIDHTAESVQQAMITKMAQLPQTLRQTLTWDQGKEMANHVKIAKATGLDIYFCDPHSPWQRGSNENTNGLLRQYFPKGTDLSFHGPGILDNVAAELNTRPRKRLGWETPAEALDKLLSEQQNSTSVAPTG